MAREPTVGSPLWWLAKLEDTLAARLPTIARYEAYYAGQHRLAFATSKFRESFGNLFAAFSDNWCDLVVDAAVERLSIEGFRFGQRQGDKDAWRMWQENKLDAESAIAHTEAVKCGTAYVLVSPGDDGPQITAEHPSQVIVACAPGNRHKRVAALKKWVEDDHALATVYLPDRLHKFISKDPLKTSQRIEWVDRADITPNPLGLIPVVPLENNPTMLAGGQSDLDKVIAVQDAINKLVADMIVASEFAAFRQRWATGVEIPIDPDTGRPLATQKFLSSVSRMWTVGDPDVKFGEFDVTDLGNYVKAIEMLIQHLAAQTRTPPHYLLGQSGTFPSGESLKSTETGLVAKVRRKQRSFGEGWEEALRLAFKLRGDEDRARMLGAETIWADPEARTEGERVDALLKMRQLGVPLRALWERWGATQEEIKEWESLQQQESLFAGTITPNGRPEEQGLTAEPLDAGV